METVTFRGPDGKVTNDPSPHQLRQLIDSWRSEYWNQGSGDATIEFKGPPVKSLLVLPNPEYGIYLKYIEGTQEWLSLENHDLLRETTECSDEWYASVGLFLPKEKAWAAIAEFCRTGNRTEAIAWMDPRDMPEEGNW